MFSKAFKYVFTWQWTKQLLYWLLFSAGTMSECAFLLASVWMSLKSSVPGLITLFMNSSVADNISTFATSAYVALPEMIVGLACLTVIGHWRTYKYTNDARSKIWACLYAGPTLVFIGLSIWTLANSVANTTYTMPGFWVVIRALAGYIYAFLSLIYTEFGKEQEADRLAKKDKAYRDMYQHMLAKIRFYAAQLHSQKENLARQYTNEKLALLEEKNLLTIRLETEKDLLKNSNEQCIQLASSLKKTQDTLDKKTDEARKREAIIRQLENENSSLNAEYSELKAILEQTKKQNEALQSSLNKTAEDALEAYSAECIKWLNNDDKTASLEEIIRFTGHTKRKVEGAYNRGEFKLSTRNKDLILKSSLVQWLRDNQPKETEPKLKVVREA